MKQHHDIYVAVILLNYDSVDDPRAKEIPNNFDLKQNHTFNMSCGNCHVIPWGKGSSHFLLMTADHKEELETSMNALIGDLWTKYDVDHEVVVSPHKITHEMIRDEFVGHSHWTKASHARHILTENVSLLRQAIRDPEFYVSEVRKLDAWVDKMSLGVFIRAEETTKFERSFGHESVDRYKPAYIKNVYTMDFRILDLTMVVADTLASEHSVGELQSRLVYNDKTLTLAPNGYGACISWSTKAEPKEDRLVCDALNIISLDRNYRWAVLTNNVPEIADLELDNIYFIL